jgi:hypothetical protein
MGLFMSQAVRCKLYSSPLEEPFARETNARRPIVWRLGLRQISSNRQLATHGIRKGVMHHGQAHPTGFTERQGRGCPY